MIADLRTFKLKISLVTIRSTNL